MSNEAEDFGVKLGTWYAVVRRARLSDPKKKCFALTVGSYADTDGTSVKAGIARLSTDCEMGYSTARRYLAWMRKAGLIELARFGNGKKATRSDEYRLTIQPHTEKALNALTQAEYGDLVQDIRKNNSDSEKDRRVRSTALTQEVSAVARESAEPTALTQRTERSNHLLRSPMSELPPKEQRSPLTGGAPPPGPRRRPPPSASATDERESPYEPLTPAQDQQRNSLPHARPPNPAEQLADVIPIENWRSA